VAIVILALAAGGAFGAYRWQTDENAIEQAVLQRVHSQGIGAERVSCSKDHSAPAGSRTATFHRCNLHGKGAGGEAQAEVCVMFIGERVATLAEGMLIPYGQKFCKTQA
jgi:hypothetical protein